MVRLVTIFSEVYMSTNCRNLGDEKADQQCRNTLNLQSALQYNFALLRKHNYVLNNFYTTLVSTSTFKASMRVETTSRKNDKLSEMFSGLTFPPKYLKSL